MDFLKKFQNVENYTDFVNSDNFKIPNVSLTDEDYDVHYTNFISQGDEEGETEPAVTLTYRVSSPDESVAFWNGGENVKRLYVDGEEITFDPVEIVSETTEIPGSTFVFDGDTVTCPDSCFLTSVPSRITLAPKDSSVQINNDTMFYFIVRNLLDSNTWVEFSDFIPSAGVGSVIDNKLVMDNPEVLSYINDKISDDCVVTFALTNSYSNVPEVQVLDIIMTTEVITGGVQTPFLFEYPGQHTVKMVLNNTYFGGNGMFSYYTNAVQGESLLTDSSENYCKLQSVVINDKVTSILPGTFYESSLYNVKIGSSVISIDGNAFLGCSGLKKITCHAVTAPSIDSGTFKNVSTFGKLICPDGSDYSSWLSTDSYYLGYYKWNQKAGTIVATYNVTDTTNQTKLCNSISIFYSVYKIDGVRLTGNTSFTGYTFDTVGEHTVTFKEIGIPVVMFYNTPCLKSVKISKDITSIGERAFIKCPELETIVVSSGNAVYDSRENCNCIIETSTNTLIAGCKNSFIPDSVTSVGEYAFSECSGLTSVVIPDSVTSIGSYAFDGCSGLTGELIIPDSVTNIGGSAFSNCSELTSLEIGSGVTSIGDAAFYGCSELTGELIIPDSVTSIGNSAFYNCSGLASLEIGSGCTSIGNHAFRNCSGLTGELVIPDLVTSIGSNAFDGCKGLTSLEIGSGCTSIGGFAFNGCSKLIEITCHAVTAPSISNNTFINVKTYGILYIPFGSDYSSWMSTNSYYLGYYNWTQQVMYTPIECTSLSITADDVNGRATNTIIYWTAVTNGVDLDGNPMNNITLTGKAISSEFPQNTSETETVERTITFEYMGVTASTTITQGVWISQGYTVDLNSQWQLSTSIANPDSATYDGVYESFSNKGKDNTAAIMYIDIVGYENFKFYIRSYAEGTYDYVVVSNLDATLTNSTTSGTTVKFTTSGKQNSGTTIDSYTLVEFSGIDSGEHRISVMYRKDASQASGTDQGYVLIPKNQ